MGFLRLFLALLVVFGHAHGLDARANLPIYGGVLAVKLFFLISGFYMAMILDEGKYASKIDFYSSRVLRLAPCYFVVLAAVLISQQVFDDKFFSNMITWFRVSIENGTTAPLWMLLPNLTVIGSDVVGWICYDLTKGFYACEGGTLNYIFVSQIWSVGVELECYILAPFLLKRPVLLGAFAVSVGFYIFLIWKGLNHQPWNRMVMPGQLLFFCLGIVAYHFSQHIARWRLPPRVLGPVAGVATFGSVIVLSLNAASYSPDVIFYSETAVALLCVVTLPSLSLWTQRNVVDRTVGAMSYPLYLCHTLTIGLIAKTGFSLSPMLADHPYMVIAIYSAVSLAGAALLTFVIEIPWERTRHRLLVKKGTVPAKKSIPISAAPGAPTFSERFAVVGEVDPIGRTT